LGSRSRVLLEAATAVSVTAAPSRAARLAAARPASRRFVEVEFIGVILEIAGKGTRYTA
jgi:hypothetical protein